jgi:hypothetical protein
MIKSQRLAVTPSVFLIFEALKKPIRSNQLTYISKEPTNALWQEAEAP